MSQFRVYAKVVAIVDLVMSAISILVVIGLVIAAATTAAVSDDKQLQDGLRKKIGPDQNAPILIHAAVWIMIVIAAVCAVCTAIQVWAAIRLMSATDVAREPGEALRFAITWRNVTIIFLTLGIIGLLGSAMYISVGINLLIRGAMIYIVFRYIQELEMMLNPSFPVSVTVQK